MKYSTSNKSEADRALEYLNILIFRGKLVEVKAISPRRSLPQNNYLHLLLSAYGAHFGYTLTESKHLYKLLNKDIYAYYRNDVMFYRSSADLSTEEMTKSIDRFRQASADQDYPLPAATDTEWLKELDNLIEQSRYYL